VLQEKKGEEEDAPEALNVAFAKKND